MCVLISMISTKLEIVNDAYILETKHNNIKQAFLDKDPEQTKELIQPHQVRAFGIIVDDFASRHLITSDIPGGQCIKSEIRNN